jgi:Fic family protein
MLKEKLQYLSSLKEKSEAAFPKKSWDPTFIEKLKLALTYHSNKIEGNTLTYGETLNFLENGLLNPQRPGKDYIDIKHHQEVLDQIFLTYDTPLTVQRLKELHFQLMRSPDQWSYDSFYNPGQFKIRDNYVVEQNGKLHKFLPAEEVADALEKLIKGTTRPLEMCNSATITEHPVFIAAYFHHIFINIHPFDDGNGRIARIATNILLLKNNIPPFVILETERTLYFEAIKKSRDEFIDPTAIFFADKIIQAMENQLKGTSL